MKNQAEEVSVGDDDNKCIGYYIEFPEVWAGKAGKMPRFIALDYPEERLVKMGEITIDRGEV